MPELPTGTQTSDLAQLLQRLRQTEAMCAKGAIRLPARLLPPANPDPAQRYAHPGDDTAAFACGDHYQLLAMEGMLPGFVASAPWFAGWSAVMANVSDIAAMGGRACAVVNAWWHHDDAAASELLRGIGDACHAYGVIAAGGHSSCAPGQAAGLAVAITGIARRLLSVLHVAPGQELVMVVDLEGGWHGDTPYWKAFQGKPPQRLRSQLEVLPQLAEAGLLHAARDISNAGILGSLLMLLEATGCGARIDLDALPHPGDGDLLRWLQVFPSYGFLLTLDAPALQQVSAAFAAHRLSCARIGRIDDSGQLVVAQGGHHATFWNLRQTPFTGMVHAPMSPATH